MVTQGKSDVGNLIHLNSYYTVYSENEEKLIEFCPGHEIIKYDIEKFRDKTFDWKIIGYEKERELMGKQYTELEDTKGLTLLHVKPFIKVFPLKLIEHYLRAPFI